MQETLSQPNTMEDIVLQLLRGEMKLSYSALSAFQESPKDFVRYKTKQRVTTDAMVYGSMLHCLILEPEDFEKRYFCFDDTEKCREIGGEKPRATKAYKEWKAYTIADAGDRIVISPDDYLNALAVANNVQTNRAASKVLRLCPQHEVPVEWEYKNFKFHGFIDADGEEARADLKSCADASPRKFQSEIIRMGYHMQAAMYNLGAGIKPYYIIAVDKTGGVSVHKLHDKLIEKGMEEYDRLVGKFNECILSDAWDQSFDFWADRYDGIFTAEPANWMF